MKDKKTPSMIEYRYFSIKNPDDENMELAKVNIWFADENSNKGLTDLILTKERLSNLIVFVVLNMEEYWNIEDSTSKWIKFLTEHVVSQSTHLSLEESDGLKEKMKDLVMNFHEPFLTDNNKILNK